MLTRLQCDGCESPGWNVRYVADLRANLCPAHEQECREGDAIREDDDSWQMYD